MAKKKPNVRDQVDQEMIDNADEFYAYRYLGRGSREKLGPYETEAALRDAVRQQYEADDRENMSTNAWLKQFSVYAVTYVHSYPHTTHWKNIGRGDV